MSTDSTILVFFDPQFPADIPLPTAHDLTSVLANVDRPFTIVGADELSDSLGDHRYHTLVWLHGSCFPKACWQQIYGRLQKGMHLVLLGGRPFTIPVRNQQGSLIQEPRQLSYHRSLGIHDFHETPLARVGYIARGSMDGEERQRRTRMEPLFHSPTAVSCILHVGKGQTHEGEMGSEGVVEATIRPIFRQFDNDGYYIAAPVVVLDHIPESFHGGQWLFAFQSPFRAMAEYDIEDVKEAVTYLIRAVTRVHPYFRVRTEYASYAPEDPIAVVICNQNHANESDLRSAGRVWTARLSVSHSHAPLEEIAAHHFDVSDTRDSETRCVLEIVRHPGLYNVEVVLESSNGLEQRTRCAFWVKDEELLNEGQRVSASRYYLNFDGSDLPVVGTTYMDPDAGRRFLEEPNPWIWDRDFALLRSWGVRYIRTGIWTGWDDIMQGEGPREDVLRAFDAFLLTAKYHGIEVCFTFFSFLPHTFGGKNSYLDPDCLASQRKFIEGFVSRHRETTNVHWDLINEPSTFDPLHPFEGPVTNGDAFEQGRFEEWLQARYPDWNDLLAAWDYAPNELVSTEDVRPPSQSEINFAETDVIGAKRGLRWLDYVKFSEEMVQKWTRDMSQFIKEIAGNQLITVGQDEALPRQRPTTFAALPEVDYTCVHSWWLVDNLLWDGIFSRFEQKPMVVQETGIMHVERATGAAWRTELDLRNLLERKFAYGFASGGAGVVQWIWNTNYFMDNPNESTIGALRADGSFKPETFVIRDFSRFVSAVKDYVTEPKPERIGVLYPEENAMSHRSSAIQSTMMLTRVLSFRFQQAIRQVRPSELLKGHCEGIEILFCPCPHNVSDEVMAALLDLMKNQPIQVIWTGPISWNESFRHSGRVNLLTGSLHRRILHSEETVQIDDAEISVEFSHRSCSLSELEVPTATDLNESVSIERYSVGPSTFIWCPVPIELAEDIADVEAIYRELLPEDLKPPMRTTQKQSKRVFGRKIEWDEATWYIYVSESGRDEKMTVIDEKTKYPVNFCLPAGRVAMWVSDTEGEMIATYGEVTRVGH